MTEQIEADEQVFQRVLDRVERGVRAHKEMEAEEVLPFIRAAERWRRASINLFDAKMQAEKDSMSLGPPKRGQ